MGGALAVCPVAGALQQPYLSCCIVGCRLLQAIRTPRQWGAWAHASEPQLLFAILPQPQAGAHRAAQAEAEAAEGAQQAGGDAAPPS